MGRNEQAKKKSDDAAQNEKLQNKTSGGIQDTNTNRDKKQALDAMMPPCGTIPPYCIVVVLVVVFTVVDDS